LPVFGVAAQPRTVFASDGVADRGLFDWAVSAKGRTTATANAPRRPFMETASQAIDVVCSPVHSEMRGHPLNDLGMLKGNRRNRMPKPAEQLISNERGSDEERGENQKRPAEESLEKRNGLSIKTWDTPLPIKRKRLFRNRFAAAFAVHGMFIAP
jgi:hypothetical protein